jgi:ssDNA-binding Zn-finger/Zn-ribbon topoisomerase 1
MIIQDGETKCPICGAELRSNGNRRGHKQYYCTGVVTHYHRSGTRQETKDMSQSNGGISEQDFRRQFDNRYILREAVKELKKGQLLDQRKFIQNLKLVGPYKDILDEVDFESFRGKINSDKIFWSHPETIAKLKSESLLR